MSNEPVTAEPVAKEPSKEEELHVRLQSIFGRASEADPIYEEMGRLEGVSSALDTSTTTGLPSEAVENHRTLYGKNQLPKEKPITFFQILLAAWSDTMIIILCIAAVVSLVLGLTVAEPGHDEPDRKKGWIEGVAIIISVLIVTTVSSVNDYRKELKFRKLTEANEKQAVTVIRSGEKMEIDVTEIVVGDLLFINPGLVTPADGFYVRGSSVVIDESAVTGENDPKKKSEKHPFILTGTVVNTAEDGWMLVGAVGETSFGGKLLMESRQEGGPPPTPLQDRLDAMAGQIGLMGMGAAVLLFVTLSIIEAVRLGTTDNGNAKRFLEYFIIAVAIVVVAVPEGLPLAVTISLAYSQSMMLKDNNQVRRLKACETMGNATQICSDKTGTLTQNLMSVVQVFVGGKHETVNKPGDFLEPITFPSINADVLDVFVQAIALCSSSVKQRKLVTVEGKVPEEKWVWDLDKGNKTDNAVLDLADRLRLDPADPTITTKLPHQHLRDELEAKGAAIFPFTSERKRMSVVVPEGDHLVMFVKGGSDVVFPLCDRILDAQGNAIDLDDTQATEVETKINEFASKANRTIGVAFAKLPAGALPDEEPNVALTWIGLLGIQDPLRPEVTEAVSKCQMAGVMVRMCTGDNKETAIAISKECGIFREGDLAVEGKEFRSMVYEAYEKELMGKPGQAELTERLKKLSVVARCQPLDKQLLVLTLMVRGEVIAVTGDGTNDAPALRLAHVGFVMRSGTDIAVKSADIVLLDDNFRSVQRAVVWGRTVNDNIRKFLQLQLTVNIVSVLLTFIGSVSSTDSTSPLSTVQLLWLNLIMDTFAAVALATEMPNEECLHRGPVNKHAPLISRRMWCTMLCQSAFQLTVTLLFQHLGHEWFETEGFHVDSSGVFYPANIKGSVRHTTMIFNVFVWCVIFNEFNARKLYEEKNIFEGFGRSRPFFLILVITIGFQVFAVEVAADFMRTTGLNYKQWLACVGIGLIAWPVGILSRFIPITEPSVPLEFDKDEVDDEGKKMLEKLEKEIDRHIQAKSASAK